MKLVYFDTSHLAALAKTKQEDRPKFESFIQKWKKKEYVLTISQIHIFEILRHSSQTERQLRFDLLKSFLPFRIENQRSQDKEIRLALLGKEAIKIYLYKNYFSQPFFSEIIYSPKQVSLYSNLDTEIVRKTLEAFYEATKLAANAQTRPHGTTYQRHRLSDVPNTKPSHEDITTFNLNMQKAKKGYSFENDLITPELFEASFDNVSNLLNAFLSRASNDGFNNAFAEVVGVDSNRTKVVRKPVDTLVQNLVFELDVRRVINEFLKQDDETIIRSILDEFSVADCPGIWLANAVEIQLRKANDNAPSNLFDMFHLIHLPYVNLFFADKRTTDKVKRVLSSTDLPETLRDIQYPISVPNNIEEFEKVLFSTGL